MAASGSSSAFDPITPAGTAEQFDRLMATMARRARGGGAGGKAVRIVAAVILVVIVALLINNVMHIFS